ncbi:molybdate transport system ATP-binding protein [Thermosporothrix hazakensis]|uniref:ABC-type quaternary amine transporter n=2 Tax=Thermosporothrix TaxID=768650 RepID=A0A326U2I6_THEHA|nr:ABC transporter ATP-binding protein [Thermosporothrix hazakensis]PZW25633.1 molybdate transport system ATP-binding protein [Thermosporothrix hazakensis]BBH89928.1 ABC transporter ATP-binding protein [Thermosporothrix sp. COM3]GCE48128.1 ABC transporter ATP-binding protein [Thermosporothrix hazakensis]
MLRVAIDTHVHSFHLSLDFMAASGKTTVLLGESGAGKSTVLRALAGLLKPERGHISFDDAVYFDSEQRIAVPPQLRPFGYVFQDYVLFPHLTVFENVAFGLRAQRLPGTEVRRRVGETLERLNLTSFEQRKPTQLSGGQQQRVAIARALVLQPSLLLLDEPMAALDVQTRREVRQELRRLLQESGITAVLVTHHYLDALLFGHTILVLDRGRLIQQGDQRELLEYPRSSYVAELVGVNFLRGRVLRREDRRTCAIGLSNGGTQVEVIATVKEEDALEVGAEAFLVVDPRSVSLYQSMPDTSARNIFRGEIMQLLRTGGHLRVSMSIEQGAPPLLAEITEASAARMELHEGKIVYATFKATEAHAYT